MLKFYIHTPDIHCTPDGYEIDEPVGWDKIGMRLRRDKIWRGFFDFFDDSLGSLQFDFRTSPLKGGGQILKELYDTLGAEAYATLTVKFQCAEGYDWDVLYKGQFVFSKYKYTCGDICYVEIGLENNSKLQLFRNRYDQKVDLDSRLAFDRKASGVQPCDEYTAQTVETKILFAPPNVIHLEAYVFGTLSAGKQFCITGTAKNDGIYTVATANNPAGVFPVGGGTMLTVEEPVAGELTADEVTFSYIICVPPLPLMPVYDKLGVTLTIPNKPLREVNTWEMNNSPERLIYTDESCGDFLFNEQRFYAIAFEWDKDVRTELKDSSIYTPPYYGESIGKFAVENDKGIRANTEPFLKLKMEGRLSCTADMTFSFRWKGKLRIVSAGGMIFNNATVNLARYIKQSGTWEFHNFAVLAGCGGANLYEQNLDIDGQHTIFGVPNHDEFYLYIGLVGFVEIANVNCSDPFRMYATFEECKFEVQGESNCNDSTAKVYFINEALSRCTEAYTNDGLRVYSDYFGREDSQPYQAEVDGCGSLEAITSGLRIRNAVGKDDLEYPYAVSMKHLFDSLNAIHNIGMGAEADWNREGKQLIRIEPVKYFYQKQVLMFCEQVRTLTREAETSEIYSSFKCGYKKGETESISGLNDLFGQREYRTDIKNTRSELNRLSDFIASDVAIEVTRRQYGKTSKDWRYDNDSFIFCLNRGAWSGEAVFSNQHTICFDDEIPSIVAGSIISISGTVNNNGTYHVVSAVHLGFTCITVTEFVISETAGIELVNNTTSIYTIDQGGVTNTAYIVNADFGLNYPITPARNTIRHLHTLFGSFVDYEENGRVIFTAGTANYQGISKRRSDCLGLERALEEDHSFKYKDLIFVNPDDASDVRYPNNAPLYRAESVRFTYPVTYEQYKTIAATPYGLVAYSCADGEIEVGWIDNFVYKPYDGEAEFELRPAYKTQEILAIIQQLQNFGIDGVVYDGGIQTEGQGTVKTETDVKLITESTNLFGLE